jgi:hypothetical protein
MSGVSGVSGAGRASEGVTDALYCPTRDLTNMVRTGDDEGFGVTEQFELLMTLVDEQLPALFAVGGVVYVGHVQSCLAGEVVAVARPYGTRDTRQEYRWALDEIRDMGRLQEAGTEPDDPLIEQAHALATQAQEYDRLSLAERLLANRNGGQEHGSSNR